MTGAKKRYRLLACPECGEQDLFAGFCDVCNRRRVSIPAVPVDVILDIRDEVMANSSEVPRHIIAEFVDILIAKTAEP